MTEAEDWGHEDCEVCKEAKVNENIQKLRDIVYPDHDKDKRIAELETEIEAWKNGDRLSTHFTRRLHEVERERDTAMEFIGLLSWYPERALLGVSELAVYHAEAPDNFRRPLMDIFRKAVKEQTDE